MGRVCKRCGLWLPVSWLSVDRWAKLDEHAASCPGRAAPPAPPRLERWLGR